MRRQTSHTVSSPRQMPSSVAGLAPSPLAGSGSGDQTMKMPLTIDRYSLPLGNPFLMFNKQVPNALQLSVKPTTNVGNNMWVTAKAEQLVEGIGLFQWSYVFDDLGTPNVKPAYVGIIPPHFSEHNVKLFRDGGWGFSSDGVFRGDCEGSADGRLSVGVTFTTGERVTVRLDTEKETLQLFVGKKVSPVVKLVNYDNARGCFPAVSISNFSTSVKIGSLSDISPVSQLAFSLQGNPNEHRTWERLHSRMMDGEKIQMTENGKRVELAKEDVKARVILWGDIDYWHKELGPALSDPEMESRLRKAAENARSNFLNTLFILMDEQRASIMEHQEEQTLLIQSVVKRLDQQELKHQKEMKRMEDMCAQAAQEAAEAKKSVSSSAATQAKGSGALSDQKRLEDMCAKAMQEAAEAKKSVAALSSSAALQAMSSGTAGNLLEQKRLEDMCAKAVQEASEAKKSVATLMTNGARLGGSGSLKHSSLEKPDLLISTQSGMHNYSPDQLNNTTDSCSSGTMIATVRESAPAPAAVSPMPNPLPEQAASEDQAFGQFTAGDGRRSRTPTKPLSPQTQSRSTGGGKSPVGGLTRRRSSMRPMAKSSRIAKPQPGKHQPKPPARKISHKTSPQPQNLPPSSNEVILAVRKLRDLAEEIRAGGEKGSPSDDDLRKLDAKKLELGKKKLDLAKRLLTSPPQPQTDQSKSEVADLVETLTVEGDHTPGNRQLVAAFIEQVPTVDWAGVVADRGLAPMAAFDGSLDYLDEFLSVPNVKLDAIELIQGAFFNQTCRIPAALVLLKHKAALHLEEIEDDVSAVWHDFFEDVASEARAIPKEDRKQRMELLTLMASDTQFKIYGSAEGTDGQTIFSRACKEGDVELMHLLLEVDLVHNVNRVQSDTTNGLIQATIANKVDVVQYLTTAITDLDVKHVSSEGSVMYLAKSLCRDAKIVAALSDRGAPLVPPPQK